MAKWLLMHGHCVDCGRFCYNHEDVPFDQWGLKILSCALGRTDGVICPTLLEAFGSWRDDRASEISSSPPINTHKLLQGFVTYPRNKKLCKRTLKTSRQPNLKFAISSSASSSNTLNLDKTSSSSTLKGAKSVTPIEVALPAQANPLCGVAPPPSAKSFNSDSDALVGRDA